MTVYRFFLCQAIRFISGHAERGATVIAMILIFLLTKIIIEKNAVPISMVKVLGYSDKEISSLYIRLTTAVVILSALATGGLSIITISYLWKVIMYSMNGWFTMYFGIKEFVQIVVMLLVSYFVIMLLDVRRIKRIPMTEALKNVE